MRHWNRSALAAIVLMTAMASSAPVVAVGPRTRWVDGDGHAGPGGCGGSASAHSSIQAAVDASDDGDTVVVCPGTYVGQVRIRGHRDGLTLRSSSPSAAVIKAPPSVATPLGFRYIVLVDHVDGVTVRGFRVITRTRAPCDSLDVAVAVVGSRHAAIRGNHLLAPGSDGSEDCTQGIGIAVANEVTAGQVGGGSPGFTASATIGYNEVRDARFGGIASFAVTGRTKVDIVGNSVRAYFGQPPAGTSSITDFEGGQFGIALFGRTRGAVRDNVVQGSSDGPIAGPTFFAGIAIAPAPDGGPSSAVNGPIDIRGNLVRRVGYGLLTQDARQLNVRGNKVANVVIGMAFAGLTDSTVRDDTIGAKTGGIVLAPDSTDNTLRDNRLTGNGGTCQDGSAGGGTAGTANHWSGNDASQGSDPAGICPHS